jgi:quercetin 2,3-dioxygenase
MSGPATAADVAAEGPAAPALNHTVELTASHDAMVGAIRVRRALPRRARRTVGAWCFADHMGPAPVTETHGLDVGPHPHIGLQTVTWLIDGEVLHRDSLGTEQVIRPGQLNLMTAGHGVAHSEEATGRYAGVVQGMQLWVAQPDETRHGAPAFEHHAELPQLDLAGAVATVLVGDLAGVASPARRDSEHVGADLVVHGGSVLVPVTREFEYGLVVLEGAVRVDDVIVEPGHLAYVGRDRDELAIEASEPARLLLLGGVPLAEPLLMWWNYVARTREEIVAAHRSWDSDDGRFGTVDSPLPRISTDPPPWRSS